MRNEQLNNTCILFDKSDEAQQKAIIKFYNDNEYPTNLIRKQDKENCIGVRSGELDYWYKTDLLKVIELPSDYYPTKIVESELIRHEMEKDMEINLINQSEIDILIDHWFNKYNITRK